MKEAYPRLRDCVSRIDDYMEREFGERCPHGELLYLMIHVNQLYAHTGSLRSIGFARRMEI